MIKHPLLSLLRHRRQSCCSFPICPLCLIVPDIVAPSHHPPPPVPLSSFLTVVLDRTIETLPSRAQCRMSLRETKLGRRRGGGVRREMLLSLSEEGMVPPKGWMCGVAWCCCVEAKFRSLRWVRSISVGAELSC